MDVNYMKILLLSYLMYQGEDRRSLPCLGTEPLKAVHKTSRGIQTEWVIVAPVLGPCVCSCLY